MYGMVNKALRDMVQATYGEQMWEAIARGAGLSDDLFLSMSQYSDDLTYTLVRAASEVLRTPAEQLLQDFGSYWVNYTAREGYGELMQVSGSSIWEFLENLDNLHARVGLSFPSLKPPSFRCSQKTPASVHLHYRSGRPGLAHLVIGLLRGLGERFLTPVEVVQLHQRQSAADEDVFLVRLAG